MREPVPMGMVFIDINEELNRMISISNLMPISHIDAIEACMVYTRDNSSTAAPSKRGAQLALDMLQAVRELKSAGDAYARFIIELAESGSKPAG